MENYPLKKNQDIEIEITGITGEGSGVGHYNGVAVFTPDTAVGDVIECHIIKTKKSYAIGKVKSVIKSSRDRITPDCPVFSKCGGCVFRHIDYSAELKLKRQRVIDAFSRIGHMDFEPDEILTTGKTERYRNKAQYPVRLDEKGLHIGFFARNSHRVADCRDCLLQPKEFRTILDCFAQWIRKYNITVYNEETHKGLIRHIYIRKAFSTGDIMVCAVINGHGLPKKNELISGLIKSCGNIKSIAVNENTESGNVILGKKCSVIWGSEYIEDILCGIRIRISPLSFYQVNRDGAELLYKKAAEFADVKKTDTVLDLYCGAGTIGLSMADKAGRIIGAEIIPQAVEDAKANAEMNNIKNAEFICGDAAEAADVLKDRGVMPEVVIVDPPRKGCSRELLDTIAEIEPKRLVYVSCDPATLARDCGIMSEKGYSVQKITPVDMFPRTSHVETVALLVRQQSPNV
ncbi:MAG: 23S rRNA (uracil(1939)-C(5))-methyltransferase RlmD [Clostridiales bacterium]|nr:23S rRNA (uracil(1939)-C(5))-methyltransferase RlmD [Clostridiales bacterium]